MKTAACSRRVPKFAAANAGMFSAAVDMAVPRQAAAWPCHPGCEEPSTQVLGRRLMHADRWTAILLCLLAWSSAGAAQTTAPARPVEAATRPAIIDYQRGIRINWKDRQVEVQGQVVLRQGALELFACSPLTREHESIVCINARPLHLFQALGLIGLTPGHPSSFNPATGRYTPAEGDPVEIDVQYLANGQLRREPIERWMRYVRPGDKPGSGRDLEPQPWVFAGSYTTEGSTFAADPEGTVIALVDFASALIALPDYHSESNAELWLEPATERIPPLYTPCTLIFRQGPIRLVLDSAGRIRLSERLVSMAEATAVLRGLYRENSGARFRLTVDPQCPADREAAFLAIVDLLRIPREDVVVTRANTSPVVGYDPTAMAHWVHRTTQPAGDNPASLPAWNRATSKVAGELATRARIFQARSEDIAAYLRQLALSFGASPATSSAPATQMH